jgi:hypothetical protein|tara:strand:- start:12 stop:599 length:588 start_codon:yes stop_codon:yes gene_type:complete
MSLINYNLKKPIDHKISEENMRLLCKILYEKDIMIFLMFGTLLGIYRDSKIIEGDNDIDLAIFSNQKQKFLELKNDLKNEGFNIINESKSIISIIRMNNHLDISILYPINFPIKGWISGVFFIPKKLISSLVDIDFKGFRYYCPKSTELMLEYFYGKTWKIPSSGTAKASLILSFIQKYLPKKIIKYILILFFRK